MVSRQEVVNHCLREPAEECQDMAMLLGSRQEFLTIYWSAGLINEAITLNDAVGLLGLSPGHIDRGCSQLAEVDEAGSTWRFWGKGRKEVMTGRFTVLR